MKKVVIIGNGVAGITAARHIRKLSECDITIVSAESHYFYSRTALMYIYMGHMRFKDTKPYEDWFWKKNRINLVYDYVQATDFQDKKLQLLSGGALHYDVLILATGSKPRPYNCPGIDAEGVRSLYFLQDLDKIEQDTKKITRAAVVGGGLIGIELAEMLHSRGIGVDFLIREQSFWKNVLPAAESELVSRHIERNGIQLHRNTTLEEVNKDEKQRIKGILANGNEIPCEFLGITIGVTPNIGFLDGSAVQMNRGILVNEYLETNIEDVYAIGDCAEMAQPPENRKSIEAVWYTARMMGETVAHTICGRKKAYNPGVWFNSAKFFHLEYQTYGVVNSDVNEEQSLYWENDKGNKAIRVVFDQNHKILGFNAIGVRLRHEVAERWIKGGVSINEGILQFDVIQFDPEFYPALKPNLMNQLNKKVALTN